MGIEDARGDRPTPRAWTGDAVAAALDLRCDRVEDGLAVVRMSVRDDMVNGIGVVHGGVIFTLADAAFAAAANERGAPTATVSAEIEFLLPVRRGDVVTAIARRVAEGARSSDYEVIVSRDAEHVARARVRGVAIPG